MLNLKYYQALERSATRWLQMSRSFYGEDVGESGGIFGQTKGLFDLLKFRVRDTPIAENGFVSTAIGRP